VGEQLMTEEPKTTRTLTSVIAKASPQTEGMTLAQRAELYGVEPEVAERLEAVDRHIRSNILSDLPTQIDALGFAPVIKTLSDIALSPTTETPITIAVNGKWGSGKTSILQMVQAQAQFVGFSCIWLNAWSLESSDNLIASVAAEVQREIRRKGKVTRDITKRILEFVAQVANALTPPTGVAGRLLEVIVGASAGTVEKIAKSKRTTKSIDEDIQEVASVVSARLSFQELVSVLLEGGNDTRLIIFLDDVDRALPDQVATILKNLKLILEVPRCVFVIGMDMDVVGRLIENHYMRHSSPSDLFGLNYLEKIVQLTVNVPTLTRSILENYLDRLYVENEIREIVKWAPDDDVLNPRRLKKYINWTSITLQLLNAMRLPATLPSAAALRALSLRRDYPQVYSRRRLGMPFSVDELSIVFSRRATAPVDVEDLASYLDSFDSRFIWTVDNVLSDSAIFSELLKSDWPHRPPTPSPAKTEAPSLSKAQASTPESQGTAMDTALKDPLIFRGPAQ
jgi:hypothetical protein